MHRINVLCPVRYVSLERDLETVQSASLLGPFELKSRPRMNERAREMGFISRLSAAAMKIGQKSRASIRGRLYPNDRPFLSFSFPLSSRIAVSADEFA